MNTVRKLIERHPVIAILRGVRPEEVVAVVDALIAEASTSRDTAQLAVAAAQHRGGRARLRRRCRRRRQRR